MASPARIRLTPSTGGVCHVPELTQESADEASRLLTKNHEKHHIFFNQMGFHNHIAHHLLTIYALGASPKTIKHQYERNASYQRPPEPVDRDLVDDKFHDPADFAKYLGEEQYYHDYLLFFQKEMERMPGGYTDVVNEYLFKGDKRADDLLGRLYAGFLHPIIHLGFGVEFEQPAIVAEALAQAAVHDSWLNPFLLKSEKQANAWKNKGEASKSLVELLHAVQQDEKIRNSPHWKDDNKLRDGVFKRAGDEMIACASQWHVNNPDELASRTAEMYDFCAYFAGAAQHPPKQVKFDFFYMHSVNCSVFFPAFLQQDWISEKNKIRLLEWKGRTDLAQYVSRGVPRLLLDEVMDYQPKGREGETGWDALFRRIKEHDDDGHGAKLVRALAKGHEVAEKYEKKGSDWQIKGDAWLKLANMAIDSVEDSGEPWVRSCGFDQAWEKFEDRPQARL